MGGVVNKIFNRELDFVCVIGGMKLYAEYIPFFYRTVFIAMKEF